MPRFPGPFTLTLLLVLLEAAPLAAGGFEEFPLPRTVHASVGGIVAGEGHAWVGSSSGSFQAAHLAIVAADGTATSSFQVNALAIAIDPLDGSAWYATQTKLGHVAINGERTEYPLPLAQYGAYSMVVTADFIWMVRAGWASRVSRTGQEKSLSAEHGRWSSLTTGSDGNVWVVSTEWHWVGKVAADGELTPFALGDDHYPIAITSGSDGNLWISSFSGVLTKVTTDGTITHPITENGPRRFLSGGTAGFLWWDDGASIKKFNLSSGIVDTTYAIPTTDLQITALSASSDGVWWGTEDQQFGRISVAGVQEAWPFVPLRPMPERLASSASHLWFTAPEQNQIGRMALDGEADLFVLPNPHSRPLDITGGPDGAMWFTEEAGDRIGRIDTSGNIQEFAIPTTGGSPANIVSGSDGNLWFTLKSASRIGRITPAGVVTEFPLVPGRGPTSIASGPDGNLWFTERDAAKIGRITPDGAVTEFWAGGQWPEHIVSAADGHLWYATQVGSHIITTSGDYVDMPGHSAPAGQVAGPDGALWGTRAGGLSRLTLDGELTSFVVPQGMQSGAITVGPDGNLWLADVAQRSLYRVTQDAPLSASGTTVCVRAGNEVDGVIASFVDPGPARSASEYTASFTSMGYSGWPVTITQTSPGHFEVSSTFNANAGSTIEVTITSLPGSNHLGGSASASTTVAGFVPAAAPGSFNAGGGSGVLSVATASACSWTATSPAAWITFPEGASGNGSAVIPFVVAPNETGLDRSVNLQVEGRGANEVVQKAGTSPAAGLYLLTPCRLVDSRSSGGPVASGATRPIPVWGQCGIPSGARAIVANVTAVSPSAAGWFVVYPYDTPRPGVSTMNYRTGRTRASNSIISMTNAWLNIFNSGPGATNVVIDVTGYFQ